VLQGDSLFDNDGTELNAHFSIVPLGGQLTMIFESAGGPERNSDYNVGLRWALERLGHAEATLSRIEVDSKHTQKLSAEARRVEIEDFKLPLDLASVKGDASLLRQKIGAGGGQTARSPSAKPNSSGNSQKRLRLFLSFAGTPPTQAELTQLVRRGPPGGPGYSYAYEVPPTVPLAAEDARRTRAGSTSKGQGFEPDVRVRQAVEEYAMLRAEQHYSDWEATRCERENLGYDIKFERGLEEICVEVKGTRGDGTRVIVTANEVRYARANPRKSVLFIVSGIRISDDLVCSEGQISIFEQWDPDNDGTLDPKDYYYTPSKDPS